MTDDIVKYLRLSRTRFNRHAEAADEIERLRGAAKWAVDILKNDERLLEEARQLIDLAIAQAEKWKDLASEYYYLDPKCECHLCDRFREAIDDGNR